MATKKADDTEREPKPKKCFVMMPISDVDGYPPGHFIEVYEQLIAPAVSAAGYECEWAPSTSAAHMIQLDIVTKAATFDLAICDLSTRNGNVLFEYGIRQAFDKPTVLIRDDKTARLFDVLGFRDVEYDHRLRVGNTLAARDNITKAILDTVEGSTDNRQIFSLVKLMGLTQAALPSSEMTRDDARFALIENKLDAMASMLTSAGGGQVFPPRVYHADKAKASVNIHGGRVLFFDDRVLVRRSGVSNFTAYRSFEELTESDFWRGLSLEMKRAVEREIVTHTDLLPF